MSPLHQPRDCIHSGKSMGKCMAVLALSTTSASPALGLLHAGHCPSIFPLFSHAFLLMRRDSLARSSLKGVSAARNRELFQYQQQCRAQRAQYRQELAGLPTKSVAAEARRRQAASRRDGLWTKYLARLKGELQNPASAINRDRHRCRPVRMYRKSEAQRQQGEQQLSKALEYQQIARRRWIALLGQQIEASHGLVTRSNLDARIREAIAKPTSYNVRPDAMLEQVEQLRTEQ